MNDRRFPWVIVIPRIENARDWNEVEDPALHTEVMKIANALQKITGAEKMNIASLGNVVAQLHIHIIARFENDAAWPAPIWGHGTAEPYQDSPALIEQLKETLS